MPTISEIKHAQEVVSKILRFADDRIAEPIDESDLLKIEDLLWLLDELEVCHRMLDAVEVRSDAWKLQERLEILIERCKAAQQMITECSSQVKQATLF